MKGASEVKMEGLGWFISKSCRVSLPGRPEESSGRAAAEQECRTKMSSAENNKQSSEFNQVRGGSGLTLMTRKQIREDGFSPNSFQGCFHKWVHISAPTFKTCICLANQACVCLCARVCSWAYRCVYVRVRAR